MSGPIRTTLLACSAWLALLPLAAPVAAQTTLYVNAQLGDDTNAGTSVSPLKTVNEALDQMDAGMVTNGIVYVQYSAVPVAPRTFGGAELAGWNSTNPFPIQMIQGVDLVGLAGPNGERPVITIDETNNQYTAWDRAIVIMAPLTTLEGFEIDGSRLDSSAPTNTGGSSIAGVYIEGNAVATILDCEIWDWHTEVRAEPGSDTGIVRLTIEDSYLHHAWPTVGNEGHAALEYEGPGNAVINVIGGSIAFSHDAIEPEVGSSNVGSLALTVDGVLFNCNENGLELGGPYDLSVQVLNSTFSNNYPHTNPALPAANAIGLRAFTGDTAEVYVRECVFENYSRAVFLAHIGDEVVFDFGTDADPGLNTFCQDDTQTTEPCVSGSSLDPTTYYSVAIDQRSATPSGVTQNTILAAGNWFIGNNQGASSARILNGLVTTPTNSNPGIGLDCTDDRNYAITMPPGQPMGSISGAIDFGSLGTGDIGTAPEPCTNCP